MYEIKLSNFFRSSFSTKNILFRSYLGEKPFFLFKEREDPADIYVMIRNRMKNNLLTEFYLEDAIKLAKRFFDALPDSLPTVKRFVEVVRLELQSHIADEMYTRKRGLYKFSMLLNRTHQHEFESSKIIICFTYAKIT